MKNEIIEARVLKARNIKATEKHENNCAVKRNRVLARGGKIKARKSEPLLPIIVVILCILGLVFIYSASNYVAEKDYDDKYYFVKKQAIGYFLGAAAYIFFCFLDYRKLKKFALSALIISLVFLALVLTPLGKEVYGARRWLAIGPITVQPSEIVKLCYVIFCAAYISKNGERVRSLKGLLPIIGFGFIICVLIMLEPNMSVTVCVGLIMMSLLFLAGASLKYFLMLAVPLLCAVPVLIIVEPYRLKRLQAFINPWSSPKGEGYQLIQSLYAFGSGGLFGVGLFNSRQKLKFLPFSESDFILSVISEECGFVGVALLIALYGVLFYRMIKIACNKSDLFGYYCCIGIAVCFIVQVAVNALVVTGSIPPTGLPLPLISSGNTQIIMFMSAAGIVNSAALHDDKFD